MRTEMRFKAESDRVSLGSAGMVSGGVAGVTGGGAAGSWVREHWSSPGVMKPEWARLLGRLEAVPGPERARLLDSARRIISEQGITYNVYGDQRGMERPWELDPLPFLISAPEWKEIESGLVQRASLINGVLADCYGPQQLVQSGDLPPALLYAQSDFLRPVRGVCPRGNIFLHLYAADIARAADGRWWVLSDRTQIPTGAGYALANRLVTSRVMPEVFREFNVERMAVFFRKMRESLAEVSPRPGDEPRVVILTPGPYNETYFEQAYLARYLGYTLVEGKDLIVQGGRVFLKTLSGLELVDVILRRVDDGFCDPLELRNDSILGVPGLVEAMRAGSVQVANTLGSGVLQSPAFKGFMPGLCRRVLGEELRMPSLATWWCGQEVACRYVREHWEELVLRPVFGEMRGYEGWDSKRLREAVEFAPHRWVAQERIPLARVPCWEPEGWVERPMVLRVYLCATRGGYVALPGGLVRTGAGADQSGVSMQEGGASKDVWVLGEAPVEAVTLLRSSDARVELRRVGNNLPSRLADNFFWLGRYAERLDGAARTLRAALLRFSPESAGGGLGLLAPLLRTLEIQEQIPPRESRDGDGAEGMGRDFAEAFWNPQRSGSLRALSQKLVHLAMLVRDRTSNDVWRALSGVEAVLAEQEWSVGEAIGILNRVLLLVAGFKGIAHENMTRSQGWRFLDIGQRLERAFALCGFLRQTLLSLDAGNPSLLESVLEVADSTITYRSRYNLLPNLMAVYDLVILDETNPRSVLFQLNQLQQHFEKLPAHGVHPIPALDERLLLETATRVRLLDPRELGERGGRYEDSETLRTLDFVMKTLPKVSEILTVSYFSHSRISWIHA